MRPIRFLLLAIPLVALAGVACQRGAEVHLFRIPEDGRMPQAAAAPDGTVHVMYYRGILTGGDLLYVQRPAAGGEWTPPVTVNSTPRSAIGMGPMDGGDLALELPRGADRQPGDEARLHATWFLTSPLRIFYARGRTDPASFEPQRVLWELGDELLEARPSVAADGRGGVYVTWHASTGAGRDDARRAVYLMESRDGGETFSPPVVISAPEAGACGCCSPEAFAAGETLHVSYRGAGDNVRRGQRLLTRSGDGAAVTDVELQPWPVGACPVTTTTFAQGPDGVAVAWETQGQVFMAPVGAPERAVSPEGDARFRRKNPAIATNQRGETLMAWGDAPGYRAGGVLHWQRFGPDGRPLGPVVSDEQTIASGSGPAVVTTPDGDFVVIY